jgi:hypothetical protein
VSLSEDGVIERLRDRFVCVWRNIEGKEAYAGQSNKHGVANIAAATTNGAGHHNVQMLLCAPDGRVLHALPGYWDPAALRHELDFALELLALDRDAALSERGKAERFTLAHLAHIETHAAIGIADRSTLQHFDAAHESAKPHSDFFLEPAAPGGGAKAVSHVAAAESRTTRADPRPTPAARILPLRPLKTVDRVVHERMAKRPLLRREAFDIAGFIDMGVLHYDAWNDGCRLATH